ncbi:MAG: helix-turn-helix domain-containing protein [Psychrilyobacter sp.]|nr:helix-turn-helix domain-containing protein [Psychrilyobacter sp.]
MSKKLFTEKEIKILSKNKNIFKISSKSIVYALEFKEKFIEEYSKGKLPRIIFQENGFDIEILGIKRVEQSAQRWKKSYNRDGLLGLKDSREHSSGRPKNRELTDAEKMEKLEAKIRFLEIENEFLKKLKKMRRGW